MLANGLSAPQHSTYFVILEDGRDLVGTPPGVARKILNQSKIQNQKKKRKENEKQKLGGKNSYQFLLLVILYL